MMTWRELISEEMENQGEGWDQVVAQTLTEKELDVKFDDNFGSAEGIPFTLWTKKRVYFPKEYDGAESVRSVSRDPDGIPTEHV